MQTGLFRAGAKLSPQELLPESTDKKAVEGDPLQPFFLASVETVDREAFPLFL
jgi:hypothetical protein